MLRKILRRAFSSSKLATPKTLLSHNKMRVNSSNAKKPTTMNKTHHFNFILRLICFDTSNISPNSTALSYVIHSSQEELRKAITTHTELMTAVKTLKSSAMLSSRDILPILVNKLGKDYLEALFPNQKSFAEFLSLISLNQAITLWQQYRVSHMPIPVKEIKATIKKLDAEEANIREDNSKKEAITINNIEELTQLLKFYIANNNSTKHVINALAAYEPKNIEELLEILAINYQDIIIRSEVLAHLNVNTLREQIKDAPTLTRVLATLNNTGTHKEADNSAQLKLLELLGVKYFNVILSNASTEERLELLAQTPLPYIEALRKVFFSETSSHKFYSAETKPRNFNPYYTARLFATAAINHRKPAEQNQPPRQSFLSSSR